VKTVRRWTLTHVGPLKTLEDLKEEAGQSAEKHEEQAEERQEEVQRRAEEKKSSRRGKIWAVLGVAAAVAVGGVVLFVTQKGCSEASGFFEARGEPLTDFTMKPTACKSGQRSGFHGVVIISEKQDEGIKIVEDPIKGTIIQVQIPGSCTGSTCKAVSFEREDCAVYDVVISPTNTTVNDIRVLEGHLKLDCKFDTGGTAKADITFKCD
jgi:hypothetical protein